MRRPRTWVRLAALATLVLASTAHAAAPIETVKFPSGDVKTTLVGYLFRPDGAGAHAAIVMLHGRSGPYASQARGAYSVTTLSGRHLSWGRFWQEHGYVALLVDSSARAATGPASHAAATRSAPPR